MPHVEHNYISLRCMRSVDFEWIKKMSVYNLSLVVQSLPHSLSSNTEGIIVDNAFQNFRGVNLQNSHSCLAARHVEKFCEVTSPGLGVHMLNFGPIFEFLWLKNSWGTPVFDVMCIIKPCLFSSPCRKLRGHMAF